VKTRFIPIRWSTSCRTVQSVHGVGANHCSGPTLVIRSPNRSEHPAELLHPVRALDVAAAAAALVAGSALPASAGDTRPPLRSAAAAWR
jgi:hypothetical protein